jgi:hypothetical protein
LHEHHHGIGTCITKERVMNNRNQDQEQEEQARREQELREEQERMAASDRLRQPSGGEDGKDPVIINRGG